MSSDVLTVAQIATPFVVGVVGFLVRKVISDMARRQDETNLRVERAEERIERMEINAVSKEDWLRESGRIAQRQEKLIEDLAELKGQSQASVITAAVAAVIKRQEESN